MFTRWTISNFKSIREPASLDLAPLTIFSGINSSGKSAFMQSILMVAQSLMSVVDDEALLLNGRFLQLGRLKDILHYGNDRAPIHIGFDWLPADELRSPESLVIHVDAKIKKGIRRRLQGKKSDKSYPYVFETTVGFGRVRHLRDGNRNLTVLRVRASDVPSFPEIHQLSPNLQQQIEDGIFSYTITNPPRSQLVGDARLEQFERAALTNILPTRLLVSVDSDLQQLIDDAQWIVGILDGILDRRKPLPKSIKDLPLSPKLSDVFRKINLPKTSAKKWEEELNQDLTVFRHSVIVNGDRLSRVRVLRLLTNPVYSQRDVRVFRQRLVAALSEYLRDLPPQSSRKGPRTYEERLLPVEYLTPVNQIQKVLKEQIYYLGPLRDKPRVIYETPPLSEQWSVGLMGEYTAAMLDEYRNRTVDYPVPPQGNFLGHYVTRRGKLIDAVTLWLQRMGLVDTIDTEEAPKVGYRLTVNSPGLAMPLDLTSVGVGVSQVLPTLVLALLAPIDSVLIFEQPELHLHPKIQSVLGDFFLAISLMGKQCLVETHSEHLINRLRRRIVESEVDTVLPKLRIYFVEKDGPVSQFHEVQSNEFGTILKWPEGFFDEAESEAGIILELQMDKRRQARQKRNKEHS